MSNPQQSHYTYINKLQLCGYNVTVDSLLYQDSFWSVVLRMDLVFVPINEP